MKLLSVYNENSSPELLDNKEANQHYTLNEKVHYDTGVTAFFLKHHLTGDMKVLHDSP